MDATGKKKYEDIANSNRQGWLNSLEGEERDKMLLKEGERVKKLQKRREKDGDVMDEPALLGQPTDDSDSDSVDSEEVRRREEKKRRKVRTNKVRDQKSKTSSLPSLVSHWFPPMPCRASPLLCIPPAVHPLLCISCSPLLFFIVPHRRRRRRKRSAGKNLWDLFNLTKNERISSTNLTIKPLRYPSTTLKELPLQKEIPTFPSLTQIRPSCPQLLPPRRQTFMHQGRNEFCSIVGKSPAGCDRLQSSVRDFIS